MRAALQMAFLVALSTTGCTKSSATDLSTPESTLGSFFNAIKESRIPSESRVFLLDEVERATWKLRCETRGCKRAEFKILRVQEMGERGATLIVDYRVFGKKNQSVMHGSASEIRFERRNSNWGIVQFGKRRSGTSPDAKNAVPKVQSQPDAAAEGTSVEDI